MGGRHSEDLTARSRRLPEFKGSRVPAVCGCLGDDGIPRPRSDFRRVINLPKWVDLVLRDKLPES
jgi:hypothetical protein